MRIDGARGEVRFGEGRLSVRRVVEVRFGEGEAVRVAGCGWRGEDKFSPHVR